jgi:hypothetical protein
VEDTINAAYACGGIEQTVSALQARVLVSQGPNAQMTAVQLEGKPAILPCRGGPGAERVCQHGDVRGVPLLADPKSRLVGFRIFSRRFGQGLQKDPLFLAPVA